MNAAVWIGLVNTLLILMGGYILTDIRSRIMRLENLKMGGIERGEQRRWTHET
jgi:5-carboxymethyl-2-hydroxymuconate isomerase